MGPRGHMLVWFFLPTNRTDVALFLWTHPLFQNLHPQTITQTTTPYSLESKRDETPLVPQYFLPISELPISLCSISVCEKVSEFATGRCLICTVLCIYIMLFSRYQSNIPTAQHCTAKHTDPTPFYIQHRSHSLSRTQYWANIRYPNTLTTCVRTCVCVCGCVCLPRHNSCE